MLKRNPSDTPSQSGQSQQQGSAAAPPDVELDVAEEQPKSTIKGTIIDTTEDGVTIIVSEDRLRLVLTNHANSLRALGWIAPLGIFLSLLTTLVTSDFKTEALGLSADAWHTIFIGAAVIAGVWLGTAALMRFAFGGRGRAIDNCVNKIKKTTASGKPRLD